MTTIKLPGIASVLVETTTRRDGTTTDKYYWSKLRNCNGGVEKKKFNSRKKFADYVVPKLPELLGAAANSEMVADRRGRTAAPENLKVLSTLRDRGFSWSLSHCEDSNQGCYPEVYDPDTFMKRCNLCSTWLRCCELALETDVYEKIGVNVSQKTKDLEQLHNKFKQLQAEDLTSYKLRQV
jgi:hypothetical protein